MNKNEALFQYCLRLGDNSLILGHRLSEWCGHGPILEEDIAMNNIALDLIGQSRLIFSYAGAVEGKGRTEDDIAYHRDVMEFRNAMLLEQPNGDFGVTMTRQFLFDVFNYHLYEELKNSKDKQLAAIAEKSLKETTYHLRHSTGWINRLGDGTEESHQRVQTAVDDLWMYTNDLFDKNDADEILKKEGITPDLNIIRSRWDKMVKNILTNATLKITCNNVFMMTGSRNGKHTEHLGYILAE